MTNDKTSKVLLAKAIAASNAAYRDDAYAAYVAAHAAYRKAKADRLKPKEVKK